MGARHLCASGTSHQKPPQATTSHHKPPEAISPPLCLGYARSTQLAVGDAAKACEERSGVGCELRDRCASRQPQRLPFAQPGQRCAVGPRRRMNLPRSSW